MVFTSRERANQLVQRLLYVFRVCLSVCLSVRLSVRPYLSRAQYYIKRYYATAVYYCTNRFWRLVGQDTATEYRYVLPRRRKEVGRHDNHCFRNLQLLTGSTRRNCWVSTFATALSYLLQDAYYATVASLASPVAELSLGYFT